MRCEHWVRDPSCVGVHDESLFPEETNERETACARHLYREARGRRHRRENWQTGDKRLLHDLESPAAAHKENSFRQWETLLKQGLADHLVNGVVAADILPHQHQGSIGIEQPRGVEPAR